MEKGSRISVFAGLMGFRQSKGSVFAVAMAAAVYLLTASPIHAAPSASATMGGLDDVQVGERDLQTRIALICDGDCVLEKRGDTEFFLRGAASDMMLDLADRSDNISGFTLTSGIDGSTLDVSAVRLVEYANAKTCSIGGRAAACIDLFFSDAKPAPARLETPTLDRPALAAKPALRESAPERLSRYASLAPPERLAPPQNARIASVQPVHDPVALSKPAIRENEPPSPRTSAPRSTAENQAPQRSSPAPFDYAERVEVLLGKTLSSNFCATAKGTLDADPWALGSMVEVGLCQAAAGQTEEAEQTLSRLLAYTPDNYEAHVGRALIAMQIGEKGIARKYFQDALNAPPPIEESNRIVEAMNSL